MKSINEMLDELDKEINAEELDEATGETEDEWFKQSDKEVDDKLAAKGLRKAKAGTPGKYVDIDGQRVWATSNDDLDEAVGDKEDDWFLQSDEEVDDKLASRGLRKADAGTPGKYRNVDGKRVWSTEVNEDGPVGYEGHEVEKEVIEEDDNVQETFSFDRFMDNILLTETRMPQLQPDSPQRERQARRQERPLGRTYYTR